VQGVDVWLNNPRRPLEASGTSGMKVLPNGGLNLSIPDGWWAEIEHPTAGWTIGSGEDYQDQAYGDAVESEAIYDLVEREVAPLFYERVNKIPRGWVERMRLSLMKLSAEFNTNRMVREYTNNYYIPALGCYDKFLGDHCGKAKKLAEWKARVKQEWGKIKVETVTVDLRDDVKVGDSVKVESVIQLGHLKPEDVSAQVYFGPLNDARQIVNGRGADLQTTAHKDGRYIYQGGIECVQSGRHGFGLRILPKHEDMINAADLGLVYWHQG